MGVILTIAVGAVIWVVLWGLGAKGFDGFMLFLIMVLGATIFRIVSAYLPGNRTDEDAHPDPAPFN